ncbi:MAG: ABC transporter permease [Deltaproteobacteria bacterium]|nr:ABC transporter permease [Deltaproteobacteria bacterium]
MKFLISLAIKNLFRYYKRTLITAVSIAFGIAIFIWTDGTLSWAENMSVRNLKKYETANLKIANQKYIEEEEFLPLNRTINDLERVEGQLRSKGLNYTPEVKFMANLINDVSGESYPYIGFGIEPETHQHIYSIKDALYLGEFLTEGHQILISKDTSELLNVELGDYLIVEADTKYGLHNADAFRVVGIFETPNPDVNRNHFYIPIGTTNSFLEMEGEVNLLAVKTGVPDERLNAFTDSLLQSLDAAGLSNISIQTWEDMAQSFVVIKESKRGGSAMLLFLIFIIVTIGIANTMLMAVYERTGEIGMMRAMGMTKKEIMLNFMFESAGVGFLGGLLGVIFSVLLMLYMVPHGIDMSGWIGDMSYGYRTTAVFKAQWNPEMMIIGWLFAIFSSMVVSIIPARRALKMHIVEVLAKVGKFG